MNDKAQDVQCPTCGALPRTPCRRESGVLLPESHLARKTLASVEIAMAKKKRLKLKRSAKIKKERPCVT
jgi:hypothetical protein